MSITPDILYEILQKIDYLDISRWCRSSPEFANFCRNERGQALIRQKQNKYRETQVSTYLDSLSAEDRDNLIRKLIRTDYSEMRAGKPSSLPLQFFWRHEELEKPANLATFSGLSVQHMDRRTHNETIDKKNYGVLKQLLIEYYDLLPTVKRNFEQPETYY